MSIQPGENAAIPKRSLGRTGWLATLFGLGGEGVLRTVGRMREAVDVIQQALDAGVNYCDSAPAYAGCLDYYGEALRGRRDDVFFASKTHDRTRDGSLRLLDETLRRLRSDSLDLWQLHDLRTEADLRRIFSPGGAMEALLQARDDGRVRFLGVTGHHDPQVLLSAMQRFDFDAVLVALNAADVHRLSFIRTVLPEAIRRGMGVIAMKVYAQGALLCGRPGKRSASSVGLTAERAMGYALSLPGVSTAVIGCSTTDEVDENVQIASSFQTFDEARMRELERQTSSAATGYNDYKRPA